MSIRAVDLLGPSAASLLATQSTHAEVARLMVDLAGVSEGMSVYDPVCGSGGLLIEAARCVERHGGDVRSLKFYGHELDPAKVEIASRELRALSLRHIIVAGDALRFPESSSELHPWLTFDVVLAHPPFSLADWGVESWGRGDPLRRSQFGLPPKSNADYAFVLHALASLNPNGRAVLFLPTGVLYRGGSEGTIRRALIEAGLIDAVITLPPGVHRGINAPTALLVLQRDRAPDRRDKVLLVNGAANLASGRAGQSSLPLDLSHLVQLAHWAAPQHVHRRVVSIREIEEQDFHLSFERFASQGGAPTSRPAPQVTGPAWRVKGAAGKARPELLEAYHRAVQSVAQRTEALFSCQTRGRPIHPAVAGEIPDHWGLEPLGELLAEPLRNGTYLSKTKDAKGESSELAPQFLQVGQKAFTQHGVVDFDHASSFAARTAVPHDDSLRSGDLLIRRVHASAERVGEAALVFDGVPDRPRVLWESSIVRIRPCPGKLPSVLLWAWLRHPPIRQLLTTHAHCSVQVSINQKILSEIPCPVIRDFAERRQVEVELLGMVHELCELWRAIRASSPPAQV
jgi:type I restriction-modification system DNA methylase subunit